jgi:hypothetical protein
MDLVSDWTQLTLDLKWGDISTWSLTLPTAEFVNRWQLQGIYGSMLVPSGGCGELGAPLGVIIIRNNSSLENALLSGIIISAERVYDGFTDTVTLTGESDSSFLRIRDLWPDPSSDYDTSTGWWSGNADVACDVVLGPAESCLSYYVNYNLGPWALPYRRLNYFDTAPDQQRGSQVTYQGRFQNLFQACQDILAAQTDLVITESFGIKQVSEDASTRLLYSWYEPTDKTDQAVFGTELGTISKFDYTEALPQANYIMCGGPNYNAGGNGQTTDMCYRMYTEILNETSADMYGRREDFCDYGGNTSGSSGSSDQELAIMAAMQNQALIACSKESYQMNAKIYLLPYEGPQFMDNFNLGDIVTVDIGSTPLTITGGDLQQNNIIREINITVTPTDGERIIPTISDQMLFSRSGGTPNRRALAATRQIRNMGGPLK